MAKYEQLVHDLLICLYSILIFVFLALLLLFFTGVLVAVPSDTSTFLRLYNLLITLFIVVVTSTLCLLAYLFYDLSERHLENKGVWVLSFILFSLIALPVYYFLHARKSIH